MSRKSRIGTLFLLTLLLSGCGQSNPNETADVTHEEAQETAKMMPPPPPPQ